MITANARRSDGRSAPLNLLGFATIMLASSLTGLLGNVIGRASLGQDGQLYIWLSALIVVATLAYFLIRRSSVRHLDIGRMYFAPALITIAATSLLASGNPNGRDLRIAGLLAHQVAWGTLGLLFALTALRKTRPPVWLVAYAGTGMALALAETFTSAPVLDIGLSTVGLFVMWLVANALRQDGGVMKLMVPVAVGYWAITALAVAIYVTHFSIGSMSPSTIQMPWEGGLKSVLTSGNVTGYGFIRGQYGREASFIVCAYHFVAWRYGRRGLHGYFAALAFALFLTGYGRVPLIGGAIGFGLILLTTNQGTRFGRVTVVLVVVIGLATSTGLVSRFTDLSARGASGVGSGSSGHLSLWSQHLGLFLERPLTGVGTTTTDEQIVRANSAPILHDREPLPPEKLRAKGSRGEGGWTGLLAQRGVVSGGMILALIALAITYCFSPFPSARQGIQDMILVRAFVAASLIFYITDEAPFSLYTVSAYVLGQVTMIAAVRTIGARTRAVEGN